MTNAAHINSLRPARLATASTCTGWTAKTSAPTVAPARDTSVEARRQTSTHATTCQATFTAWSQIGEPCDSDQSIANEEIASGRY